MICECERNNRSTGAETRAMLLSVTLPTHREGTQQVLDKLLCEWSGRCARRTVDVSHNADCRKARLPKRGGKTGRQCVSSRVHYQRASPRASPLLCDLAITILASHTGGRTCPWEALSTARMTSSLMYGTASAACSFMLSMTALSAMSASSFSEKVSVDFWSIVRSMLMARFELATASSRFRARKMACGCEKRRQAADARETRNGAEARTMKFQTTGARPRLCPCAPHLQQRAKLALVFRQLHARLAARCLCVRALPHVKLGEGA